ncbi:MAG: crosslink repair DNA glycosylase YcaQ family protein [Solirubrobacteraceae bacterium]
MPRERLSADQARRLALGAQGFADARRADGRALGRVLGRTGLLQIDSVNVLARAHYLPAFSRIGPYDTASLDRLSHYAPRRLFEYWGHEASLLPVALWPLMQWRMQRADQDAWGGMFRVASEQPGLVERMYEAVRDGGPITASSLSAHVPKVRGQMWAWSDQKRALEWLFWTGRITSARRLSNFERAYDVPERVIPRAVLSLPVPPAEQAQRELLRISARALGVATATDLRDYFRLPAADTRLRLGELVEEGDLLPVTVEGWRQPAYLHPEARIPRTVDARALLVPFDPLIWERSRTERIFGFRYRIEIYVPAAQRVHGYYVLPFLLGDHLVARVDLKADRRAGVLRVQREHLEPSAPAETTAELSAELELMAGWLGLDRVERR